MLEVLLLAALAGTPAPSAAPAATPEPLLSPADTAVIMRSASTNRPGFKIAVPRTGQATIATNEAQAALTLRPALAEQLYADLARTSDLESLPVEACMKSASFGTTTTIAYAGKTSPDLQCASDAIGRALNADADAITQAAVAAQPPARRHTLPVFRKNPPPP